MIGSCTRVTEIDRLNAMPVTDMLRTELACESSAPRTFEIMGSMLDRHLIERASLSDDAIDVTCAVVTAPFAIEIQGAPAGEVVGICGLDPEYPSKLAADSVAPGNRGRHDGLGMGNGRRGSKAAMLAILVRDRTAPEAGQPLTAVPPEARNRVGSALAEGKRVVTQLSPHLWEVRCNGENPQSAPPKG